MQCNHIANTDKRLDLIEDTIEEHTSSVCVVDCELENRNAERTDAYFDFVEDNLTEWNQTMFRLQRALEYLEKYVMLVDDEDNDI